MNPEISLPILIASLAFLIADGSEFFIRNLLFREMKWHNGRSIRERLAQLGKITEIDYENFRLAQMTLLAFELGIATLTYALNVLRLPSASLLVALSWILTIFLSERNLTQRCNRRRIEIEDEFPAVVEILALAIAAGESPAAAFKRISIRGKGYLAREFTLVVSQIENGSSFSSALDSMSKKLQSETLRRFADTILISISRGTPLVETLLNSTSSSRNMERVRLLNAAGKSEVSMMIPVVFLILPISMLFALFPSLSTLNIFSN
jgi:tight adherence protein C